MFIRELPFFGAPSTDRIMVGTEKPSLDSVLKYAADQVDKYIWEHAAHIPDEQKEEIRQEALFRVFRAYDKMDPARGLKAFTQAHCLGAVRDYLRDGKGFKESAWAEPPAEDEADDISPVSGGECASDEAEKADESDDAPEGAQATPCGEPPKGAKKFKQRLNRRVEIVSSEDGESLDIDAVAGLYGRHTEAKDSGAVRIHWDLVARMARVDPEIHLMAKFIRGFTQAELAPGFAVTREMLSQRLAAFGFWLDDEYGGSMWARQALYAFGLEEIYGVPVEERGDKGLGWTNEPVDLDSEKSLELMDGFHQGELF